MRPSRARVDPVYRAKRLSLSDAREHKFGYDKYIVPVTKYDYLGDPVPTPSADLLERAKQQRTTYSREIPAFWEEMKGL